MKLSSKSGKRMGLKGESRQLHQRGLMLASSVLHSVTSFSKDSFCHIPLCLLTVVGLYSIASWVKAREMSIMNVNLSLESGPS